MEVSRRRTLTRLGPRLAALAAACRGPRVADIGCDHGLLAAYLAAQHRDWQVIGVDRVPSIIAAAQARWGDLVTWRYGDGPAAAGPVDTLLIAGIGGANLCELLERDLSVVRTCQRLVLSPHRDAERVCSWVHTQLGWPLSHSDIVESGRSHPLLIADVP